MGIDAKGAWRDVCTCPVITGGTVVHGEGCVVLTQVSKRQKGGRKPRYIKLDFDTGTGEIDVPAGWKLHQVISEAEIDPALWCVIKDASFD